jgi:hypothetical protein
MLFAVALLSLVAWHGAGRPFVTNDGCQYLDAASNLASGRGFGTMLAHFDEQVARGRFPVPFTHFAPGYPLAIAGLNAAGFSAGMAAWTISALGFAVSVGLVWELALALGADVWIAALMALLWAGNSAALSFASAVAAESLFIAVLLGALVLVAHDLRDDGRRPGRLLALGLIVAAGYWLRYAGLFLVPAALLYIVWRGWKMAAARGWAVGSILVLAAATAVVPVRNIMLTGNWQGGFAAAGGHSIRLVAMESVKGLLHDVLGSNAAFRPDVWLLLALGGGAGMAWLGWTAWKSPASASAPRYLPGALLWIAVFLGAYTGGVLVAALRTIVLDMPRYLLPLYPAALAVAAAVALGRDRRQRAAALMLFIGITGAQLKSLKAGESDHFAITRQALDQSVSPGVSALSWLRAHTREGETIAAVNGQLLHCVVGRPVLATIEPAYSTRPSNAEAYRDLMRRYGARYFVAMPGLSKYIAPEQESVPWMGDLVHGVTPEWLKPAFRTENVAVFECDSCVGQ